MSARVEDELCQTLYGVRRAVCEGGLQKTRRELVGAQEVGWQSSRLCLYAVRLLLRWLWRWLLIELGDWRSGSGSIEWRIVLLGAALASKRCVVDVGIGQGDVGVALLRLTRGLRWSRSYYFWVDG